MGRRAGEIAQYVGEFVDPGVGDQAPVDEPVAPGVHVVEPAELRPLELFADGRVGVGRQRGGMP